MTGLMWLTGRLRSGAIFLGSLYLIVWIVLLPTLWLALVQDTGPAFGAVLMLILPIVVIEILLNGLVWLIVAVPWIMGVVLTVLGQILWLTAPLVFLPTAFLSAIPDVGSGLTGASHFLETFVEHLGLTVTACGAALFWVAQRLRSVNQVAVTAYLAAISIMGIIWGATSLAPLVVFLVLWLMVYAKMQQDATIGRDIRRLFQIAATGAVIANIAAVPMTTALAHGVTQWTQGLSVSLFGPTSAPPWASLLPATGSVAVIWHVIFWVGLLWGIWRPGDLWRHVPPAMQGSVRQWWSALLEGLHVPPMHTKVSSSADTSSR
ncbi:MAG: hypothetical protein C7B46_17125 [Sulfobacillus benefaciens]|uniref:Uncharacterized protein n=1 Tax=Sulfobacillus benefaciens TaxID=453960 RepID=A0A2T2X9T0_9FIRM|nr:MAG: hypothetical protein C7B46_17125 [Sulfobacillus benefaciens]